MRPAIAPRPPEAIARAEPIELSLGRLLLFTHLFLSPLLFSRSTLEAFEYPKVRLLMATAVLLAGGAVSRLLDVRTPVREMMAHRVRRVFRDPIALGVMLYLLSAAASTVTSISPRTSLQGAHQSYAGLSTVAAYTVLFFATRGLCKDAGSFRKLLVASGLAVVAASVYALLQVAHLDPLRWEGEAFYAGVRRAASTMGHPNLLGAFLVMGLPIVVCIALRARREGRRLSASAWAVAGLLAVGVVMAGLSRGAWLALLAVATVLGIGWARISGRARSLAWTAAAGLLAVALSVAGLAVVPRGRDLAHGLAQRVLTLAPGGVEQGNPRWFIWGSAVQMLRERPAFGVGLDAFQIAGQRHRSLEFWMIEGHRTPGKAHNEPLHILATQGLAGGLAAVVVVVGLVVAFVRAFREHFHDRDLVLAAFAGVVGFLVQGLFSFTVAGCATLFVTLAALLSRLGEAGRPHGLAEPARRSSPARPVVWVITGTLVYVGVLAPLAANRRCRRGFVSFAQGHATRAVPDLEEGVRMDPSQEIHWVMLGAANEGAAKESTAPGQRRAFLEAARDAFQRASELVPANAYNHLSFGRVLAELGRNQKPRADDAYRAFEAALVRDPRNPYIYAAAGRAALDLGNVYRALGWASRCLDLHPRFGPCAWIPANVALAQAMETAGRTSPAELTPRLERAAELLRASLEGNWHEDVRGEAEAASQLAAALMMLGRHQEARRAAERAVEINPGFAAGRFNLAKAHERLGDLDRAAAEYRRVLDLWPGYAPALAGLAALGQGR